MKLLRRLLGAIVFLLSTVGILCCVVGMAGSWKAQQEAAQKVETISTRLDDALQRLSGANLRVEEALKKARADLNKFNKESVDLGGGPEKNRRTAVLLRGFLQQEAGPKIYDLGGRLATLSDAAIAVSSLLRSLEEMGVGHSRRINSNDLERTATQVSELSAGLKKLQGTLGERNDPVTEKEVVAAAKDVDLVLQKCEETAALWQSDLEDARKELPPLRARILSWLLLAAIGMTAVCAWVGLSQLSLFGRGWKWCRAA
jgi:hypothetical protein